MPAGTTIDLTKLLTRSNLLRLVALGMGSAAAWGAMGTVPKMASASGAPVNDVLNTILPAVGGVVAWIWARASAVKPELIQAAIAAFANPTDAVADFRLAVQFSAYIRSQWPGSPALEYLDQAVKALGVDVIKDSTGQAVAQQPQASGQ